MGRTKRLPIDHALRMTPEDYLKDRVDDQIKWYSAKSRENKRWFLRLEILAILFSVSIPFVTDFITPSTNYMKSVVSFLGVAIAFITGLLSLMKYRDNWVEYRATAELLHRERYLYLTRAGAYGTPRSFQIFVQAVEDILSAEVSNWKQNRTQHEDEPHEDEPPAPTEEAAPATAGNEIPPTVEAGSDQAAAESSVAPLNGDQSIEEASEQPATEGSDQPPS